MEDNMNVEGIAYRRSEGKERSKRLEEAETRLLQVGLSRDVIKGKSQAEEGTQIARLDLSGLTIEATNFEGVTFHRVNFRKAELSKVRCKDVGFRNRTSFEDAVLDKVNFTAADISSVILRGTLILSTGFDGTDLKWADFSSSSERGHSVIIGSTFNRALLKGASFKDAAIEKASFFDSDISAADFTGAHLENVRFGKAGRRRFQSYKRPPTKRQMVTRRTQFRSSMVGTIFDGAKLVDVDFTGVNLSGASFRGATLIRPNFTSAILKDVALKDVGELTDPIGLVLGPQTKRRVQAR